MRRVPVPAKINLALVVGPEREDGRHEVATVLQRIDLCDTLALEPGTGLRVTGYRGDTAVTGALERLALEAGVEPRWRARLQKRIPVAAGLGGGSADAAAALRLANDTLERPLGPERLAALAAGLGADVPFFLRPGPQLAEGAGERLRPLELPQDFWVLLAIPEGARKESTGAVYARFDELGGGGGFSERRGRVLAVLERCRRPREFAELPPNDLAPAAGAAALELAGAVGELGAFRADVSGAGPAVYGLFHHRRDAGAAARALGRRARTWVTAPVW